MKYIVVVLFAVLVMAVQAATLNVRRIVNANAPPAPTNFVVSFVGSQPTNVFLTWGNSATTYSNIVVEISTNPPAWTVVTNLIGTNVAFANLYTWTNVTPFYRIKATSTNGLHSDYNDDL